MTYQLTLPMFALILFCVLVEASRELCFREAAEGETLKDALLKPLTLAGIVLWVVEIITSVIILETVPLAIAFPLMALVYVVTVLGGSVILKEKISLSQVCGSFLITAGVACVGATGL